MAEPRRARAEAALDDVSDHLGVVLQRADELLAQWSAFGAAVRGQVEREAATIGEAVAGAVDAAVARATSGGVERAIADQVGARLAALTAEIAKLEARTRAAAHAVTDERKGDRRLLWGVIGGVVLANVLLALMLLRPPATIVASTPAEPTKVEPAELPGAAVEPAATAPAAGTNVELGVDAPSSSEPSEPMAPAKDGAKRPESPGGRAAAPAARSAGAPSNGTASSAGAAGAAVERGASAQSSGASVAGGHGGPGAQTAHAGAAQGSGGSGARGASAAQAEHAGATQGSGAAGARGTPAAKLPLRAPPQKK